jgi:molybdopterin/thiamine biosynthesis adenylyltransferase/rhodanese-related sulfurtransferase/molybdopterin converting factor small subunit
MKRIVILVPAPLREYTEGEGAIQVQAATVAEALTQLAARHEALERHLYSESGQIRSFVNIYLNDEDIRYLAEGVDSRVEDGDEVRIVPSIAGGTATAPGVDSVELSPEEIQRYARHIIMPEVGLQGQEKLKQARVLLIGAGGLGSPTALYLAAAGVGTLGLVDFDVVEYSNLQRQIIHGTKDVGRSKLESARERIIDVNPEIIIESHEVRLDSSNALEILDDYDIIVDGTDNFPTRYLVNDACVLLEKPNVYGSIFRFEGQVSVFFAKRGPCYRCLFREPPPPGLVPSCAEGGVLGVLPGIVGALQANETIKLVLGLGDPLIGRLVLFDALRMRFRELRLRKDPECSICGDHPTIRELIDYEAFCGVTQTAQEHRGIHGPVPSISPKQLRQRLDAGDHIRIIDVREPREWDICKLEGTDLIPLGSFPAQLHSLDTAEDIVVICRSGVRSAHAVRLLQEAGFRKSYNLSGGLRAWSDEVDPTMPKY